MTQNHGAPSDHILGWHCIEHSPSILHAATFCIYVNRAIPHNDSRLTTTHEKAYHLQVLQNQHMHSHLNKREFVKTHSFSLWLLESCIAFSGCLSFTYFVSFLFHAKMLNCTVHGAIAAISAATHGRNHQSSFLSTSCVILCLRSRYLSFVGNQKSRSGMYSLHPTRQCYHSKNRESHIDLPSPSAREFCHNILHLLTFSSLLLPTHQCKLSNKNFCHELWPNKTPLRWREGSYR